MSNLPAPINNIDSKPRIRAINETDLMVTLAVIVGHCYSISGQDKDESVIDIMVKSLAKQVFNRFKSLTIEEVCYALETGTTGAYGEYFGLNVVSFCKFIESYTQSKERTEIVNKRLEQKQLSRPEPDKEEREEQARLFCLRRFDDYKAKGQIDDIGNVVYEYLVKVGLIKFESKKHEIRIKTYCMKFAEKRIKSNTAKLLMNPISIGNVQKLREQMKDPMKTIPGLVKVEAMNILLNHYFRSLRKQKIELSYLIGK